MTVRAHTALTFDTLTSDEIATHRDAGALVVVPVGATEQHAGHLAVTTDTGLADAVTRRAAALVIDLPVLVAPALPFGFSPHHSSHAGTISLRLDTYLAVLGDVAGALVQSGFKRVLFINGHGGNSAPLRAKVGELVTDGLPVGAVDYWAPSESLWTVRLSGPLKRAGHACEMETALALALAETDDERRHIMTAIAGLPPRLTQPWIAPGYATDPITAAGAAWPPVFQADDCGYYGDPAAADPDTGTEMLDIIVNGLAGFFVAFAATPLRLGVSRDAARPAISPPLLRTRRAQQGAND